MSNKFSKLENLDTFAMGENDFRRLLTFCADAGDVDLHEHL